jgi:hypothetical protein
MNAEEKAALIAEIEAARAKIAGTGNSLKAAGESVRRTFDIPARAKESFSEHRPAWLGGAALVGLLLSKLPARSKTVFVESATGAAMAAGGKLGALWGVVKFAGGLAKPFLGDMAAKWVASKMEGAATKAEPERKSQG